jgi:AmiR/NasT family two-component response regulator
MSDSILVVCGQRETSEQLVNIISASIPGKHLFVISGAEARRKTGLYEYEAVLIAGKLPDETPLELAESLAVNGCNGVMIVVERDALYDAHEVLDGTGVTILVKPLTKDALLHSIKLIVKVKEGGGTLEKAKLLLIQHKNFTEPQAHRYIQKLAMDKRLPREVAAQLIIKAIGK